MVVRRGNTRSRGNAAPTTRTRKAAPAKTAPAAAKASRDLSGYADKLPTDYHKAFARFIVQETGYQPSSKRDFLEGIKFACTTRTAFMASDFIDEWREAQGINKRGPKRTEEAEEAPAPRNRRATTSATGAKTRKAQPEPEPEDDDFDDDYDAEIDAFEEDSDDDADMVDDDDDGDDDDFDDDDESDDDDAADYDDFEEPAPKPRRATGATRSRAGTRGGKAAPAEKAATRTRKAANEHLF